MSSRTNPALAAGRGTPTRRNTELVMLGFAVLVVTAAQAIVDATVRGRIGLNVVYYGAGFAALWLVAHLVVRRFARYADPLILPAVALL
ncbi:MAG: FtsW/RodA/SpoVE family cell cycle protein, partial [Geodermatophilaceae bacterium]